MILLFLLLKNIHVVDTIQDASLLASYGFEVNGTFNASFTNIKTKKLRWALLSQDEFTLDMLLTAQSNRFCSGQSPVPRIQVGIPMEDNFSFSGIIEKEGVYTPLIYNCADQPTIVTIEHIFRNYHTYLDFRWIGGQYSQIGLISYISLMCLLWFANWFMHFRTNVRIHYFVSTSLFLGLGYHISSYFELDILDKSDVSPVETTCRLVFSILYNAWIFITLMLAAKGWCIYRSTLTFQEVVLSVSYVIIYNVFNALFTFGKAGKLSIIWVIISIISIALFLRELMISTNQSKMYFIAHLYVISNAGITPESTPIYAKYRLYILLKWSVIICFVSLIIEVCVTLFANPFFWINQFLFDLLQLGMNTVLCFVFRLKKVQSEDQYMQISLDFDSQSKPEELQLSDVEEIDISKLNNKHSIPWEEGMKLPSPPIIMSSPLKHETHIEYKTEKNASEQNQQTNNEIEMNDLNASV